MQCPRCGHEKPPGRNFCGNCGQPLAASSEATSACPQCGQVNPPQASFCNACGTALSGATTVASEPRGRPPSEPLPAFFKDGHCMVKGFLGEGARKKVYLCHDTRLDRDVAFALIKTEGLDDTGHQRVLREAQTMGRLGERPTSCSFMTWRTRAVSSTW